MSLRKETMLRNHFWQTELVQGDEPNTRLRCMVTALLWLMLVKVYVRNCLVLHLWRLFVNPFRAVGLFSNALFMESFHI